MPLAVPPGAWFARDGLDPASRPRALLDNHQDSEVVTSPLRPQILLANLEASGALSRRLSSRGYFALIGRLTDLIDSAVIARSGIVGKHAGDGGGAFPRPRFRSPRRAPLRRVAEHPALELALERLTLVECEPPMALRPPAGFLGHRRPGLGCAIADRRALPRWRLNRGSKLALGRVPATRRRQSCPLEMAKGGGIKCRETPAEQACAR